MRCQQPTTSQRRTTRVRYRQSASLSTSFQKAKLVESQLDYKSCERQRKEGFQTTSSTHLLSMVIRGLSCQRLLYQKVNGLKKKFREQV